MKERTIQYREYLQSCAVGTPIWVIIHHAYATGGVMASTGAACIIIAVCASVIIAVYQYRGQAAVAEYRRRQARRFIEHV